MKVARQVRQRQDRSKRSGHAHAKNTQDLPGLNLTMRERAVWKFVQVAALLASDGAYYDLLPPSARMATDAVKHAAEILEPSIIQRKDR